MNKKIRGLFKPNDSRDFLCRVSPINAIVHFVSLITIAQIGLKKAPPLTDDAL